MIIKEKTTLDASQEFIKVVVDLERKILSAYCDLHVDCAEELVAEGSEWKNLWGANVFPNKKYIQYSSMINIRPNAGNRSMDIEDQVIKERARAIIEKLVW